MCVYCVVCEIGKDRKRVKEDKASGIKRKRGRKRGYGE